MKNHKAGTVLYILLSIGVMMALSSPADADSTAGGTFGYGAGASAPVGLEIEEDFASCTDWTVFYGTLTCSSGAAHAGAWDSVEARYTDATTSNDHWAEATCMVSGTGDSSGLIIGCSSSSEYYYTDFADGVFRIMAKGGDWSTTYDGSYTNGTYVVAVQIDTSGGHARLNAWVGGSKVITDQIDTGDHVTRGAYVGMFVDRDTANADVTLSAFSASAGSYTP